eukprot:3228774-Rhodomonas_salina.1
MHDARTDDDALPSGTSTCTLPRIRSRARAGRAVEERRRMGREGLEREAQSACMLMMLMLSLSGGQEERQAEAPLSSAPFMKGGERRRGRPLYFNIRSQRE